MSTPATTASPLSSAAAPTASSGAKRPEFTDIGDPTKIASQDLSFHDFLSAINPLQHIPVVGTIYRAITGDTILPAARVLGSTLIGGPIGLITSAADAIFEQSTGKDIGARALAAIGLDNDTTPASSTIQYAAAAADDSQPADNSAPAPTSTPTPMNAPPVAGTPPAAPAADNSLAPVSKSILGAPVPPSASAPVTGSPGAPLVAASGKAPGAGWTLADYQAFAGHGMPASANSPVRNGVVPLQTTVPIATDVGHAVVVPAVARQPATAAVAASASSSDAAARGGADNWMAQAMIRGLDRYRQMKTVQSPGPQPSIDASY